MPLSSFPDVLPALASIEEEYILVDDGVPLGNLPQTGSAASVGAGMVGFVAALSSLAGAGATLLKKEGE